MKNLETKKCASDELIKLLGRIQQDTDDGCSLNDFYDTILDSYIDLILTREDFIKIMSGITKGQN